MIPRGPSLRLRVASAFEGHTVGRGRCQSQSHPSPLRSYPVVLRDSHQNFRFENLGMFVSWD